MWNVLLSSSLSSVLLPALVLPLLQPPVLEAQHKVPPRVQRVSMLCEQWTARGSASLLHHNSEHTDKEGIVSP